MDRNIANFFSMQARANDTIRDTRKSYARLKIAWTYPTGDARKYSFNPLMADGVLYVLARENSIVALDARTGKIKWQFPRGVDAAAAQLAAPALEPAAHGNMRHAYCADDSGAVYCLDVATGAKQWKTYCRQ